MNFDLMAVVEANLLSPPILFFVLGVLAAVCRSDLKFPDAMYLALTIYLLTAIGFKGGVSLSEAGWSAVWLPGAAAVLLGSLIPLWSYPLLRYWGNFSQADAASISGHYGSVSAVTFIAATNFLGEIGQPYEEYAAAFLAVMESPAIIVGIVLGKSALRGEPGALPGARGMGRVLHEAVFGRSVFLLVGALAAGFLSGSRGMQTVSGLFVTPFQGVLALFLLELGTVAGRRLSDLRNVGAFLAGFGILVPIAHGVLGVVVGELAGLSLGGSTLLGVLASSASYIAAPAAMRLSLPDANPTYSLTASLVVTFPFNVTLGIPLYFAFARYWFANGS